VTFVLRTLWYNRPVRIQLLVSVGLINLLGALVVLAALILNTRMATDVEIEASLELAKGLVETTVKELAAEGKLDRLDKELPLRLKDTRHVRVMLLDREGQFALISPDTKAGKDATDPPGWFVALVSSDSPKRTVRVVPSAQTNPIVILGEPADEIAEAWHDVASLALVWLALEALILGILYLVLGRILDPLGTLSRGMMRLEDGHYATRVETPAMKELAVLTNRFNILAGRSNRRARRGVTFTADSSPSKTTNGARLPMNCTMKRGYVWSALKPMPP
jgi:two-component system sensor histidine kinase UhpB